MKKLKSQNGAIAIIVLVSVLFLTMFLISSYMVISNKLKTQKDVIDQTRQIYENYDLAEIYNSFFNNGVIPIYSNDEYLAIGKNERVIIPELGGKYYDFTDSSNYILMNDLIINVQDYQDFDWENWQAPEYYFENNDLEGKIDYNGHTVTIIRQDGTEEKYGGTVQKDPSSVTGKWAKLWVTTENEDGTLAITDYLYNNEELQSELRKTETELLDNVTIPNRINGVVVSKVSGSLAYPFTGEFTISSGILVNNNYFLNKSTISKIVLKDNITITSGYYVFADCKELKEIEMGNNCTNGDANAGQVFRDCKNIEKITIGDNCSFIGTYPFRFAGVEEIEITCGKNTSLNLGVMSSTTKKINTNNATFNYLNVAGGIIEGDLIVNKNAYASCIKSTVSGKLEVGDNSEVAFHGTKVTEEAILGDNLKLIGNNAVYAFYNFNARKITINGKIFPTGRYAEFQNASPLPQKIETGKPSNLGTYCFGNTDIEYLIINASAEFKSANSIFVQCKKMKAVIVNLSDEWTKEDFLASIGANVNSSWLGGMATGTFYSTPIDDAENNRLIYYSTNLTKDESEVLKLISEAGL